MGGMRRRDSDAIKKRDGLERGRAAGRERRIEGIMCALWVQSWCLLHLNVQRFHMKNHVSLKSKLSGIKHCYFPNDVVITCMCFEWVSMVIGWYYITYNIENHVNFRNKTIKFQSMSGEFFSHDISVLLVIATVLVESVQFILFFYHYVTMQVN